MLTADQLRVMRKQDDQNKQGLAHVRAAPARLEYLKAGVQLMVDAFFADFKCVPFLSSGECNWVGVFQCLLDVVKCSADEVFSHGVYFYDGFAVTFQMMQLMVTKSVGGGFHLLDASLASSVGKEVRQTLDVLKGGQDWENICRHGDALARIRERKLYSKILLLLSHDELTRKKALQI